ncbi:MAG: hypothetical protein EBS01_06530 [Verrucomicrobia bacterium]|nr:hypothetical protein [Verrucomicrobiota bacterium]
MSKSIDKKLLKRVAERNGFDQESLLQVINRFDGLGRELKEQAVSRAIQTENWGQLDAFICFGFWSLTNRLHPLPEPLANIPEVAETWERESLNFLLCGAKNGSDRSAEIRWELQPVECRLKWLPPLRAEWAKLMAAEINTLRDRFEDLPVFLRGDSEMQATRFALWARRFDTNCSWWDLKRMLKRIPQDIHDQPSTYPKWRSAALGRLWAAMPHGWTEFLALDPRLKTDPVVLQKRRIHWLAYFKSESKRGYVSPKEEAVQDSGLYDLLGGVDAETGAPDADSLQNPEVYLAWRNGWLRVYRASTGKPPVPPPSGLSENWEVHSAWLQAWVRFCESPLAADHPNPTPTKPPTELLADWELHRAWREAWVRYYKTYRPTWTHTGRSKLVSPPEELQGDAGVLEAFRKATK